MSYAFTHAKRYTIANAITIAYVVITSIIAITIYSMVMWEDVLWVISRKNVIFYKHFNKMNLTKQNIV